MTDMQHSGRSGKWISAIRSVIAIPAALAALLGAGNVMAKNQVVTIAIDATANVHPIDPRIYGVAWGSSADLAALNVPLNRMGGNAMTDYNWALNAQNLAAD